jgi:hypothetical protein
MLFFPKWGPAFEMIHQEICPLKRLSPMPRRAGDKYNGFSRRDQAGPVHD